MSSPFPTKKICSRSTPDMTPTPAPIPSWSDVELLLDHNDVGWAVPAEECYQEQLPAEPAEDEQSDEEETEGY